MIELDKYVLVIVFSIILFYFIWKFLLKNNNKKLSNACKTKEGFQNYSKLNLQSDFGVAMFEGDNEVFVYELKEEPIAGPAGRRRANVSSFPKVGFKPDEVREIPELDKAIVKKNGLEYVDNNLMVPLLYHITKRMTIMIKSLQEQITDCCYK